jgi:hypothetical protein
MLVTFGGIPSLLTVTVDFRFGLTHSGDRTFPGAYAVRRAPFDR